MANPLSESEVSRARAFFGDGRTRAHLLVALAGVALADWLFYGHAVGWTLGAYGALSGLAVLLLGARVQSLPAFLFGVLFFILCGRAVVEPEPPVVLLGFGACVLWVLTLRGGWSWSLSCWSSRVGRFLLGLFKALAVAPCFALVLPLVGACSLTRVNRLRAWLIPLGLGAVFLGLFALANPVISLALSNVWEGFQRLCVWLPSLPSAPRLLFWSGVGALLWTLLRHQPRAREEPPPGAVASPPLPECGQVLTPEVIRRALAVFNALFALQTASDLWYLWGGGALPQGMTYAAYAHRGAYPLVATALLAAAFVLAAFRENSPATGRRAEHRLVYAWLCQNIFLVISAGWRLWLYVTVYSLSCLRLAAGVWMALVACGLILILVRIFFRRGNLWLIQANVVMGLAVLTIYSCCPTKMYVAGFNVRHCREAGCADARSVDLWYLSRLGYDALPALVRLERHVRGTPLERQVRSRIGMLTRSLDERLSDWRGLTPKRCYLRRYLERKYRPEAVAVEAAARQSTP